ncbi:MAG: hypothetical protein EXR36_03675 [Betaproteobacteria bacterium]|nr:hypothetical protein [Betaproteobacteria bacterium]
MTPLLLYFCSLTVTAGEVVLDNTYVRVTRDEISCPAAKAPNCGHRVIVAIAETRAGERDLKRGDIRVALDDESVPAPTRPGYFEVVLKREHPPAGKPKETIPAEKNAMLYDGTCFFVFEERLAPGDTRARHSHSHRVVIQLNRATLRQWPDGMPEIVVETVPDKPIFNPPVIHTAKNIGDVPLLGVIIEFKPECGQGG